MSYPIFSSFLAKFAISLTSVSNVIMADEIQNTKYNTKYKYKIQTFYLPSTYNNWGYQPLK